MFLNEINDWYLTLREKCPNTEFFLVHIFPHSDWIRRDTSVFSPNARKYGLEKPPYLDTFHAVPASIHNNYYELFEHNIHALSISTAADRNNIAIFYFLSN